MIADASKTRTRTQHLRGLPRGLAAGALAVATTMACASGSDSAQSYLKPLDPAPTDSGASHSSSLDGGPTSSDSATVGKEDGASNEDSGSGDAGNYRSLRAFHVHARRERHGRCERK